MLREVLLYLVETTSFAARSQPRTSFTTIVYPPRTQIISGVSHLPDLSCPQADRCVHQFLSCSTPQSVAQAFSLTCAVPREAIAEVGGAWVRDLDAETVVTTHYESFAFLDQSTTILSNPLLLSSGASQYLLSGFTSRRPTTWGRLPGGGASDST